MMSKQVVFAALGVLLNIAATIFFVASTVELYDISANKRLTVSIICMGILSVCSCLRTGCKAMVDLFEGLRC